MMDISRKLKKSLVICTKFILSRLGFRMIRIDRYPELNLSDAKWVSFTQILEMIISETGPNFQMVQIGSHDGISDDPVFHLMRKYGFRAILVEPQEELFGKVSTLHANRENTQFVCSAIGEINGEQEFYMVKSDSTVLFPGIVAGHYGLIKNQLVKKMKSVNPSLLNYECHIHSIKVETLTLETLMQKCDVTKIDYLQIDTEGYDAKIILSSRLDKLLPRIINFEHSNLSNQEKKEVYDYLQGLGYDLVIHSQKSGDTTAYKIQK